MKAVLSVSVAFSFVGLLACTSRPGPLTEAGEGTEVELDPSPPPISGGSLVVAPDGVTAWVSDADRDLVWRVDLQAGVVLAASQLEPGDEPGRIAIDEAGRAHVVLRSAGAVATIEPGFAQDIQRTEVCPEPRGIVSDPANDRIHVACNGGELVTLGLDGTELRRLRLDVDLRDVLVEGDRLVVSRFRSAETLFVAPSGEVEERVLLPDSVAGNYYGVATFEPAVSWRTISVPEVGFVVVHQRGQGQEISIDRGGYGGGGDFYGDSPGSIVESAVSVVRSGQPTIAAPGFAGVLPVDVAVAANGRTFAVAAAGSREVWTGSIQQISGGYDYYGATGPAGEASFVRQVEGEPIAVAFDGSSRLVVQTREPSRLLVDDVVIPLGSDSHANTGHEFFHRVPQDAVPLACASCHPEGRDDGRVWVFDGQGPRRTQTVAGGILATHPFHWDGAMDGIHMLVTDVVSVRMAGAVPTTAQSRSLSEWLDGLPAPVATPLLDEAPVERGAALFADSGCVSCHAGEKATNDGASVDVGTGGSFQVPSLTGVWARAPYLHDGCATTLTDRFGACGGGDRHGRTSHLSSTEIADLVAYLETL